MNNFSIIEPNFNVFVRPKLEDFYFTLFKNCNPKSWPGGEGLGPQSVLLSRSQVLILPVPILVLDQSIQRKTVTSIGISPQISRSLGWIPSFFKKDLL
jgi:hypothetical protein